MMERVRSIYPGNTGATDYVSEAVKMAAQAVKEAAQMVRGSLTPLMQQQQPQLLSPKEQLERFLKMSPQGFETLKNMHGEESFNRYLVQMRQLAQET